MKKLAALVLLGLLCACSSNGGNKTQNSSSPAAAPQQNAGGHAVLIRPSNMTFKAAEAACAGTLGSVTFSMGHARAHAASGVDLNEQPESQNGVATMTFTDKANGKKATIAVNGHNSSVTAKNVTAKSNRSVACIKPD